MFALGFVPSKNLSFRVAIYIHANNIVPCCIYKNTSHNLKMITLFKTQPELFQSLEPVLEYQKTEQIGNWKKYTFCVSLQFFIHYGNRTKVVAMTWQVKPDERAISQSNTLGLDYCSDWLRVRNGVALLMKHVGHHIFPSPSDSRFFIFSQLFHVLNISTTYLCCWTEIE